MIITRYFWNRSNSAKNCLYIWQLNKLFSGKKLNQSNKMRRDGSGYIELNDKIEIIKDQTS